jgi:beta-1,4-N-acetylglucosaminyltransferase
MSAVAVLPGPPPDPIPAPAEPARRRPDGPGAERILLVCSSGGHLLQLLSLEPAWRGLEESWVTLRGVDSESLLAGRDVVYASGPTNRSVGMAVKNTLLAWRIIHRRRPRVILSTGAAVAVPFVLVGKAMGCRVVYVESLTRIRELSLSGRLVYPLVDAFFVQWPTTTKARRARFAGALR